MHSKFVRSCKKFDAVYLGDLESKLLALTDQLANADSKSVDEIRERNQDISKFRKEIDLLKSEKS